MYSLGRCGVETPNYLSLFSSEYIEPSQIVQQVGLWPHSSSDPGSVLTPAYGLCGGSMHVLYMSNLVYLGCSGFLPPPKDMPIDGLVIKLPIDVNEYVHGVFRPHTQWFQDRLRIHCHPDQDKKLTEDEGMNT